MTVNESRRYEMFVRINQFGEEYPHLFPGGSVGAQALAAVATSTAQLAQHAASKMSTRKEGTKAKEMARASLIEMLEAMARTARSIAAADSGFDDGFRLPEGRGDSVLLTAGRVFLAGAEAGGVKDRFIAHGLSDTFLADLKTALAGFEQRFREREAGKNGRTAAQAGIDAALTAGFAAVKTLDVIVNNQLRKDPVALAVWKRDRRMTAYRGRGAASATPADASSTTDGPSPVEAPAAELAKPASGDSVKPATGEPVKLANAEPALKVAS